MFSKWISAIPIPSATVSNALKFDSVFEANARRGFKLDPNLFSFIDEIAQFVQPVH